MAKRLSGRVLKKYLTLKMVIPLQRKIKSFGKMVLSLGSEWKILESMGEFLIVQCNV